MNQASTRHPPIGETGQNVIANIERLRQARRLSLRQLSVRLGELGRPTLTSGVHRTLQGGRRVDADDLVAFAAVLGVSPAELLAPPSDAEVPATDHAALREVASLADRIGEVLAAPGDPVAAGRLKRALQKVRLEVAEVLEESAARPGKAG